jgi:hypothetical protein
MLRAVWVALSRGWQGSAWDDGTGALVCRRFRRWAGPSPLYFITFVPMQKTFHGYGK